MNQTRALRMIAGHSCHAYEGAAVARAALADGQIDPHGPVAFRVLSRGTYYAIHESGAITYDKSPSPSGGWHATALVRLDNFGQEVARVPFSEWTQERLEAIATGQGWRCKNGKPRWFLADYDHGAARLQMAGVDAAYAVKQEGS